MRAILSQTHGFVKYIIPNIFDKIQAAHSAELEQIISGYCVLLLLAAYWASKGWLLWTSRSFARKIRKGPGVMEFVAFSFVKCILANPRRRWGGSLKTNHDRRTSKS